MAKRASLIGLAMLCFVPALPSIAAADAQDDIIRIFGRDPGDGAAHACFTRHYDRAHLASHPQQNVTDMTVFVSKQEGSERYYALSMQVSFRHLNKPFQVSGSCSAAEEGASALQCGIECDGGHLSTRVKSENAILVEIPESVRLFDPDDTEQEGNLPDKARFGADDKLFRLDRTALTDCVPVIYDDEIKARVIAGTVTN